MWDPTGTLWSRQGNQINNADEVCANMKSVDFLVDGELIIKGKSATYYWFDLPGHKGTLTERWQDLTVLHRRVKSDCIQLIPTEVNWDDVIANEWEGVVFKKRKSTYTQSVTPDKTTPNWIKYRAEWL